MNWLTLRSEEVAIVGLVGFLRYKISNVASRATSTAIITAPEPHSQQKKQRQAQNKEGEHNELINVRRVCRLNSCTPVKKSIFCFFNFFVFLNSLFFDDNERNESQNILLSGSLRVKYL